MTRVASRRLYERVRLAALRIAALKSVITDFLVGAFLSDAFGESGFHLGAGLQGSENRYGFDGRQREFRRYIGCYPRKPKNLDLEFLAGRLRRFEVRTGVVAEPDFQGFAQER